MHLSTNASSSRYPRAERPADAEHITIYRDPEYYAGFPFNHNFWTFPDGDLLINFARARCSYGQSHDLTHGVVDGMHGEYVTLRSTDGGETWPIDSLQVLGTHQSLERQVVSGLAPEAPAEPLDWTSPDFCVTAGFGGPPILAQHLGYLQYSRDRGRSWEGPYRLPSMGFSQVYVKPDYLVRPDGLVLLFVTVGRGPAPARYDVASLFVAIYATTDGGLSWEYLSSIHRTNPDAEYVGHIYASPVMLPNGRIVTTVRCFFPGGGSKVRGWGAPEGGGAYEWTEVFESDDGGRTWQFLSRPNDWGAPAPLVLLDDGRLLMVYGYRVKAYGIRARISEDGGPSWGPELILRDDGGSGDLGYPRIVKLPGGKVMVGYYFNRADDPKQLVGGIRHIAATVFTP